MSKPLKPYLEDPSGEIAPEMEDDFFETMHGMGWTAKDFTEPGMAEKFTAWLDKRKNDPDAE